MLKINSLWDVLGLSQDLDPGRHLWTIVAAKAPKVANNVLQIY